MKIEPYLADRSALLPLFELADDSHSQIAGYIALGEIFVAREDETVLGHVQIVETGDAGVVELKSMAVIAARQGEGIGRSLFEAAVAHCRDHGRQRLIVSTATADIANLRFYQRQGFRMYRIVRDAFSPSNGYAAGTIIEGIPLRDQVFLERDLTV